MGIAGIDRGCRKPGSRRVALPFLSSHQAMELSASLRIWPFGAFLVLPEPEAFWSAAAWVEPVRPACASLAGH